MWRAYLVDQIGDRKFGLGEMMWKLILLNPCATFLPSKAGGNSTADLAVDLGYAKFKGISSQTVGKH